MKKCLFVSYRPIYPIDGGDKIRIAQQLEFLVKRYMVDVIYLSENKNNQDVHTFCPQVNKVYRFYRPKVLSYIHALTFLFNNLPIQENYFYSYRIQRFINSCINNYDFVFCANDRCSIYFHKFNNTVRYVDIIDANSMNYEKARHNAKGLFKLIYTIEYKRCKQYERWLYRNFYRAATISSVDYKYMTQGEKADKLFIVGNKAYIPPLKETKIARKNNRIVFVGNMRYAPNILATKYFVHDVLPLIKERCPSVKFYIVGAQPDKEVLALNNGKDVIVTGFVESVVPYLQEATIVVAPMLTGAGIQNKILMAMAYRCCIVTTPIGAEGLTIDNNEILVVDNAIKMAHSISKLLSDNKTRERMGDAARQYVVNNLSEAKIEKQFFNFVIE